MSSKLFLELDNDEVKKKNSIVKFRFYSSSKLYTYLEKKKINVVLRNPSILT